jgi:hypothetical protein
METNCDELISLADRVDKQTATETEPEPLIELREEIEYRRENVANIAKLLKGDIHEEFKERAQRPLDESAKVAKEGRQKLDELQARLEFHSFDSEAGSYKGHPARDEEAAPGGYPLIDNSACQAGVIWAGAGPGVSNQPALVKLATLLRGWGQLRANDSGWPVFDGKFAS